jgi:hypothetical protein
MKTLSLKRRFSEYYLGGWNGGLLLIDMFVSAIVLIDCWRFSRDGFDLAVVYSVMSENFSSNWTNWGVLIVWIIVLPTIIATTQTSWRRAHAHSQKGHKQSHGKTSPVVALTSEGAWRSRLSSILHLKHPSIVIVHVFLALLFAHFAAVGVEMQNLSGRSESVFGWAFQSYWASIVGFTQIFYGSVLVPAVQIAVVKMLGMRLGGGHGIGTETGIEASLKNSEFHMHTGT